MLQDIFREHGWSLEQGGAHYRKRECLEALKKALTTEYIVWLHHVVFAHWTRLEIVSVAGWGLPHFSSLCTKIKSLCSELKPISNSAVGYNNL
jgi:hypothetical protein